MIIYKTTNKINGKIYIGKYCGNSRSYLGSGIILKNAIKKYGKENFTREILEDDITDHDYLCEREIYWIKFYDSSNPKIGYNICGGGKGSLGVHPSAKTRAKMSISQKGHETSDEARRKMSVSKSGKNHPLYGKHHSDESKIKMSESKKGSNNPNYGKHHSDKTKMKMSEKQKGRIVSKETGDKISKANKGRIISVEARIKTSLPKEKVLEIKNLLNIGLSVKNIMIITETTKHTIYKTKNGGYNSIYDLEIEKEDK